MSTNPYQSPQAPVDDTATTGIAARSDGLHEFLLSGRLQSYWKRVAFLAPKLYAQSWKRNVLFLLILIVRRVMALQWGMLDYLSIGALLMPLASVLLRSVTEKKFTERVEASSADTAVGILRQRGFTEIVLHTDDVGALFIQQSKIERHVTPKDFVGLRHVHGYWGMVGFHARKLYLQSWTWNVLFLLVLAARRWMQLRFGTMDYLAISVLLMPLTFAMIAQLNNRALRYHKFLELAAWGRWTEVLKQAASLRGQIPEHELIWQQAKALAALGRLNEAIELAAPLANDPTVPQWLYCSRLSSVYSTADMRDEELACTEKALRLARDNAALLLDSALTLLRYQLDIPGARQLFEQARSHALSDTLIPMADGVEGILLLEEGRPNGARDKLQSGIEGLDQFLNAAPQVGATQDRFRAYLALALAALGDRPAAEHQFQLAEPRLRALKRNYLLERCQRAIATAPAPTSTETSDEKAASESGDSKTKPREQTLTPSQTGGNAASPSMAMEAPGSVADLEKEVLAEQLAELPPANPSIKPEVAADPGRVVRD
jgi:hypothetical protein